MMLQQTAEDLDNEDGVYVYFHTNECLFILRWLQPLTKTTKKLIRALLIADAASLLVHMESVV